MLLCWERRRKGSRELASVNRMAIDESGLKFLPGSPAAILDREFAAGAFVVEEQRIIDNESKMCQACAGFSRDPEN